MYGGQQWSCDVCTYKQSASVMRCAMCQNANPFMVGSGSSAAYFQPQRPPPKPKPVAKDKLKYQAKPRKNNEFGKIVYQTDRIKKEQVLDTYAIYLLNKDIKTSCWPIYVFGENDIDKARPKGGERDMIGGLAGVLGDYDTSVSFGVTTTFYKNRSVNKDFNAFKKIIDDDFDKLLEYIKNGHDIIVPSPNMQDLYGQYEKNYWETIDNDKKQVIFHNLGTGLAMIPFNYIKYIQKKLDTLKEIGEKNTTDIPSKNDDNDKNQDDKKSAEDDKNKSENDKDKDKDKDKAQGKDVQDMLNIDDNKNKNQQPQQQPQQQQGGHNPDPNQGAQKPLPQPMNTDGDEELARALAQSMQQR